jgi:hypothetical protein
MKPTREQLIEVQLQMTQGDFENMLDALQHSEQRFDSADWEPDLAGPHLRSLRNTRERLLTVHTYVT